MTSTETSIADEGTIRAAAPCNARQGRRPADRAAEPDPQTQTVVAASSPSARGWTDGLPDPTVDPRPGGAAERAVWTARRAVVRTEAAYEVAKEKCAAAERTLREQRHQAEMRSLTKFLRRLQPEERALLHQMQEDRGLAEELLGVLRTRQLKEAGR